MTLNTLRYVAPIKQGNTNRKKIVPDPKNPGNWDNAELRSWVEKASKGCISPESLCPWESGRQILRIPEADFLRRVTQGNPRVCGVLIINKTKTFLIAFLGWREAG